MIRFPSDASALATVFLTGGEKTTTDSALTCRRAHLAAPVFSLSSPEEERAGVRRRNIDRLKSPLARGEEVGRVRCPCFG